MLTRRYITVENNDYMAGYICGRRNMHIERADGKMWEMPFDFPAGAGAGTMDLHEHLRFKFHEFLDSINYTR